MRRFFCVILALALLLCNFLPCACALTKEEIYGACVSDLKAYLNDETEADWNSLFKGFASLGSYEFAIELMIYTGILRDIESNSYANITAAFYMIGMSKGFPEYLSEELSIGSLEDLQNYASGRQAEHNKNTTEAIDYYKKANGYFDSYPRLFALSKASWEDIYNEALEYFQLNTYEGYCKAYELFSQIAEVNYRDSKAYMENTEVLMQMLKPTPIDTTYYATSGSKWYHTVSNCQGMQNAVTKNEAEWKALGKTACPECMTGKAKVTSTSTMVYATTGGSYFHTESNCNGMKNPSRVTVAQAVAAKKNPCPDCVKASNVYVFATAGGKYFHTKSNCSGMKNAQYVTAAFAMQYGKTACPDCASVFSFSR